MSGIEASQIGEGPGRFTVLVVYEATLFGLKHIRLFGFGLRIRSSRALIRHCAVFVGACEFSVSLLRGVGANFI